MKTFIRTKHRTNSNFLRLFFIFSLFLSTSVFSAATFTQGSNIPGDLATALAEKIQGPGLTITNPVISFGHVNQTAIFSDGIAGANLVVDEGILLTTMSADEAFSTNNSGSFSINNPDTFIDDDLIAIDNRAVFDTVIFEFDVTLDANTEILLVNYQFASEEYNEYVGSIFNDAFGFFISGGDLNQTYNIARVLDPQLFTSVSNLSNFPPVTVNNVNNGTLGTANSGEPVDLTNSDYFIDNEDSIDIGVEFDGLTVGLNATLNNLTPGITYHFKMALADVGDSLWDTGVFVNSINGIRTPKICYDYKYKQNNRFFTEDYNITKGPYLSGDVSLNDPIEITLAIQNQEESDVIATNVKMNILDLNTSQVTYIPDSVYVTDAGSLTSVNILDGTNGMTANSSSISNIPIGDFGSQQFFYLKYSLLPSIEKLNTPIYATIAYTLTLQLSPTQSVDINVSETIDAQTPICSGANFTYSPKWDIFNIEDASLATSGKYNLFTQVVNRPFEFNLVSYMPSDYETLQNTTVFVAIEMIDVGGFHDVGIACTEPSSSVTPRIWTQLINQDNITVDVNQAVTDLLISSTDEFFGSATENTAFRISFPLDQNGTDPIAFTDMGGGNFQMNGFPDLTGRQCSINPLTGSPRQVRQPNNNNLTDQANVACGNAGAGGVSTQTLRNCLECLYDANVAYICSRDNFAMRPEAFKIKISDNAQSLNSADAVLGLPDDVNISAGYKYRYDINATSHTSISSVNRYTLAYLTPNAENNITYHWRGAASLTGCNDTDDKYPAIYLKNGAAINNQNMADNVGDYELQMRDSIWTKVDQGPEHHLTDPVHFNLNDCSLNQNIVPASATPLTNLNVGCNISSNHTNIDQPTHIYKDHQVTVNPYTFDINVSFRKSALIQDRNISDNNAYVYVNSLENNTDDLNMSIYYEGIIQAQGADGNITSNYVQNCYSKDTAFNIDTSAIPAGQNLSFRLVENNFAGVEINDTVRGNSAGANTLVGLITLPANNFQSSMQGATNIQLHVNFNRAINLPVNPILLQFNDFNTTCANLNDCQNYADMKNSYVPTGSLTQDRNVTFLYGREHIPRQRVTGNQATIPISYEFYCDSTTGCVIGNYNNVPSLANAISPNALLSSDDIRWYIQADHSTFLDGRATSTQTRAGMDNLRFGIMTINADSNLTTYIYDGTRGYPYKVTMDVHTPDWLIYNRYDNSPTINSGGTVVNNFELEFESASNWVGEDKTQGVGSQQGTTSNSSRRIQW
ncbi:choice-of-anchor L domain-containing protein [Sulfurimonas sp. MAG313]|nr:choice-of-anchor L domain-containing protein [Sulfurimonas sp. MAG313]MDF1880684.1 choice-of-anchor L domain-containing protein [Sulfurimonas sp. MAG313]